MKTIVASTVSRTCLLFCISLAAAGMSRSQESTHSLSPPIEVLKLKWEKEVRLPRNFDPSVIPTGRTFSDPAPSTTGGATTPIDSIRATTSLRNGAAGSSTAFPATPGRLPVFYVYSMKIRNAGDKPIEGIAWDYLFLDPTSGAELGRHQFISYVKPLPAHTVTLRGQTRTSPVRIVRAVNKKEQARPIERAEIQCVLFADDTVWRNRFGRKGTCEFLKNSETVLRQKRGAGQR